MYNVHLTHSLLCFEFVEFTLIYSRCPARHFFDYFQNLVIPILNTTTTQNLWIIYFSVRIDSYGIDSSYLLLVPNKAGSYTNR